jgi:tetrahydromethanopterin S-methyltransferase subunit G
VKFRTTIPNPGGQFKAGMLVRLSIETNDTRDELDEPRGPAVKPVDTTPEARLSELERKVDRLLSEREERPEHQKILERLDSLERKLDRLQETRKNE